MQRDQAWVSQKLTNFRTFLKKACEPLPADAKGDLAYLDFVPDSSILGYFGRLSKERCTVDEYMSILQKRVRLDLFKPEDIEKFRKYVELFLELTR